MNKGPIDHPSLFLFLLRYFDEPDSCSLVSPVQDQLLQFHLLLPKFGIDFVIPIDLLQFPNLQIQSTQSALTIDTRRGSSNRQLSNSNRNRNRARWVTKRKRLCKRYIFFFKFISLFSKIVSLGIMVYQCKNIY